jgi:hypothetical protein
MGPTAGLRAIGEQKYMPLVETDPRSIDWSESYTINTLNPLPAADTENRNIVFKVKHLTLSIINVLVILLQWLQNKAYKYNNI